MQQPFFSKLLLVLVPFLSLLAAIPEAWLIKLLSLLLEIFALVYGLLSFGAITNKLRSYLPSKMHSGSAVMNVVARIEAEGSSGPPTAPNLLDELSKTEQRLTNQFTGHLAESIQAIRAKLLESEQEAKRTANTTALFVVLGLVLGTYPDEFSRLFTFVRNMLW